MKLLRKAVPLWFLLTVLLSARAIAVETPVEVFREKSIGNYMVRGTPTPSIFVNWDFTPLCSSSSGCLINFTVTDSDYSTILVSEASNVPTGQAELESSEFLRDHIYGVFISVLCFNNVGDICRSFWAVETIRTP